MNKTSIEWTTFSANPLKYRDASGKAVWGCVHASPGCINCYSEALAKRYGRGGPFNLPTMSGLTPFLDDAELHKMLTAKTIKGVPVSGSRCFVGDMTDIFGEWVPDGLLDRLFAVFALRRDVTWQILTKRAERMRDYCSRLPNRGCNQFVSINGYGSTSVLWGHMHLQPWPLPNVYLGTSVEDQVRYDARIGHILRTDAAVRFLSVEPMLTPIDMRMGGMSMPDYSAHNPLPDIDWVIVGGESGHRARPFDVGWARSIVKQCKAARVPVFVKQLGSVVSWDGIQGGYGDGPSNMWPRETGHWPEPKMPGGFIKNLVDRKGGNMSEWPEDLRIRQFPGGR
jgi:protein gp37